MITKLAGIIAAALYASDVIEEDEKDLYAYGFFLLISYALFFVLTVLFGIILNVLWESVVFYFFFTFLRNYAGGIHARKEITCIFCTVFAMLISSLGIRLLEFTCTITIQILFITIGSICIFFLSPLDTEVKPLLDNERRHFRNILWIICCAIIVAAICACFAGTNSVLNPASISIMLEGVLLILGKIQKIINLRKDREQKEIGLNL